MADPLGVTASIIAVLQLSSTVLGYLVNVKDASANRKSLIREISFTRGILSTLNETVDDARVSDETWSATIRSLEDPDGPLRVLTTTLQQLATTLEELSFGNRHQKVSELTSMALQAERSGEDPEGYRTPKMYVIFSSRE